jgi:hypothetical protein
MARLGLFIKILNKILGFPPSRLYWLSTLYHT